MSSETLIWIEQYTRQPYIDLPGETGLSTGFRQCGHIHLAYDPDRREVMKRDANDPSMSLLRQLYPTDWLRPACTLRAESGMFRACPASAHMRQTG